MSDLAALVTQPRIFLDQTDTTIWDVWVNCWRKKGARAYLIAMASGAPLPKLGKDTTWKWRKVPGFKELELKLQQDPATCAQFLAVVYLPYALAYWGQVLTGEEKGNRAIAARFVSHMADPTLRATTMPKETPPPPGKPEGSRLDELIKGVGLREIERANREMDDDDTDE